MPKFSLDSGIYLSVELEAHASFGQLSLQWFEAGFEAGAGAGG